MNLQKIDIISEGSTDIFVYKNKIFKKGPGSKENKPFYNPSMELNRDFSIIVNQWMLNKYKKSLRLLDGLAASGIRGVRFANELVGDFEVIINDYDLDAYQLIKKNIEKNKIKNATAYNENLNFLLTKNKYDYIDIDPFGSPVYFIDSAMKSIINNGIIACTSTDTAALCGTYPKVCLRRYSANPFYSIVMKEVGLRILIGFLCRYAGIYNKGIIPLISYCNDHYFRTYIQIINGKSSANESVSNIKIIKKDELVGIENTKNDIGPLWMGKLQNKKIVKEVRDILFEKKINTKNKLWKLLYLLEEEADAPPFFYTSDSLASELKISPPKIEIIFKNLKNKGYDIYKTHFSPTGFKTNIPLDDIKEVFNERKR